MLHQPGVVLQGQRVGVDGVRRGEGDVQPAQGDGQVEFRWKSGGACVGHLVSPLARWAQEAPRSISGNQEVV